MDKGFAFLAGVVIGVAVAPKVYRMMQNTIASFPAQPKGNADTQNTLPNGNKMAGLPGYDCTQAELFRKGIIELNTGFGRY